MATKKSKQKEIIETLKTGNFYVECPNSNCQEEVQLRQAALFDNKNFTDKALEVYNEQLTYIRQRKAEIKSLKEKGTIKSELGALSTNFGFIMERIAPTMPSFRFKHNDCRSIFDPIDYVIFEGLTQNGSVDKLHFVDIKTGTARLSKRQKEIRNVINDKKVKFKKF
jgi:predicted Holliday junction resolvase-like endonuclease